MKITLVGLRHELQWKDSTGDLRKLLEKQLANSSVDLVAEEASGLPTTVAQRLAYKHDKPWINIDLTTAEKKLSGIYDALMQRKREPLDPVDSDDYRVIYLPKEDGARETEWVSRILRSRVDAVLCLCGVLHLDPFTLKLQEKGCHVEPLQFEDSDYQYRIVEEGGNRWCEVKRRR